MRSAKGFGRFVIAVGIASFLACGGDGPAGITDPGGDKPKVDTTTKPVDTAAARIAKTDSLLTVINDAISAMGQAAGAGGVPTSAAPQLPQGELHAGGATLATAPPPPDAAKCIYDTETVRWNCPDFTQQDGAVIKAWFQFLDDKGAPHKDIDTAKTVAVRRFMSKTGIVQTKFTNQNGTVTATDTMANADTLVLSGLKGPAADRRLNGKGSMKHNIVPPGSATVHISATTTTENFAFSPPAPNAPRYPISGKVTAIVTGFSEDKPTQGSTTTQVTTYDGSKIAKLVITTQQGKVLQTCTWDMSVANVAPTCVQTP